VVPSQFARLGGALRGVGEIERDETRAIKIARLTPRQRHNSTPCALPKCRSAALPTNPVAPATTLSLHSRLPFLLFVRQLTHRLPACCVKTPKAKGIVRTCVIAPLPLIPPLRLVILHAEPQGFGIPITRALAGRSTRSTDNVDHRRRKDDIKIVPLSTVGKTEGNA